MRWRLWIFVSAVAVAGTVLAEVGANRFAAPPLPGTCGKGITPFCADPAWPK